MIRRRINVKPITGLSNQLFCMINSIIRAQRANQKEILFGPFISCIHSLREMDLGDVVDLEDFSTKTGIKLLSYPAAKTTVQYGVEGNYRDITDQVFEKCMRNPVLGDVAIPKCDVTRASLFGDHIPYVEKHILINGVKQEDKIQLSDNWSKIEYGGDGYYRDLTSFIREYGFTKLPAIDHFKNAFFGDHAFGRVKQFKIDEVVYQNDHIFKLIYVKIWDLEEISPMWYDAIDNNVFNHLCKQMRFKQVFYDIAESALENAGLNKNEEFNVAHLRIEADAIRHWAGLNKISEHEYRSRLVQRYRDHFMHIANGSKLVVLTNDVDDPFLRELESRYKIYKFTHSTALISAFGFTGREISAIVELIIGTWCKGVFIGCHNFALKRGSTFSYLLSVMMTNRESFFIDLDQI